MSNPGLMLTLLVAALLPLAFELHILPLFQVGGRHAIGHPVRVPDIAEDPRLHYHRCAFARTRHRGELGDVQFGRCSDIPSFTRSASDTGAHRGRLRSRPYRCTNGEHLLSGLRRSPRQEQVLCWTDRGRLHLRRHSGAAGCSATVAPGPGGKWKLLPCAGSSDRARPHLHGGRRSRVWPRCGRRAFL